MESHNITRQIKGNHCIYKSNFESKGNIKKLKEYLMSSEMPSLSGFLEVNHVSITQNDEDKNVFYKTIRSNLPDDKIIKTWLGKSTIDIKYEICFDDTMLVSKCVNPKDLQGIFNYTEVITIEEEDGILYFEREADVVNLGKRLPFGSSFQKYDDQFNDQSITFYRTVIKNLFD